MNWRKQVIRHKAAQRESIKLSKRYAALFVVVLALLIILFGCDWRFGIHH